jgi:hypothetical protein
LGELDKIEATEAKPKEKCAHVWQVVRGEQPKPTSC